MQAARSASKLLAATRTGSGQQVRHMSGHGTPEENAKWMKLWTYTTYVAVPVCGVLGVYMMSQSHGHHEQPKYAYLKKRDRKFPWGNSCDLFDFNCGKAH